MKLGKHQKSGQRCQELCWNYCVFCTVNAKKANKNLQQRTLSGFITKFPSINYGEHQAYITNQCKAAIFCSKTLRGKMDVFRHSRLSYQSGDNGENHVCD